MNRKVILFSSIGLLVTVLLASGAYTAVRLFTQQDSAVAAAPASGARVMESIQVEGDGPPVSVRTTILPAPELPSERSISSGIILDREDNSLTVGTGAIELSVEVDVDGTTGEQTTTLIPSTTGPELEVVLTQDTLVYRDVTDLASQLPDSSGEITITQEIRAVSSNDEIKKDMEIQVWGTQSGDRIVADVIVFGPLAGGQFE